MAKQMSVFNSAKKGYENQEFPERPWTQQVENDSVVEIHENNLKTTKEINVEEILHSETPFAAVLMDGKYFFFSWNYTEWAKNGKIVQ